MKNFVATIVLIYLRFWAKIALAIHRPTIIGIAGSTGKSSTKQILYAMMIEQSKVASAYGNSETGLPLGILGLTSHGGSIDWLKNIALCPFKIFAQRGHDFLILEMATDEPAPPKNMDYLLEIVQPDVAIHLNAQPVHTQQFSKILTKEQQQLPAENQEEYIVKAIGFEDAKIITRSHSTSNIFNGDDQALIDIYLPAMADQPQRTFLSFGHSATNKAILQDYSVSDTGSHFSFTIDNQAISLDLTNYILPQHYQQSLAAALLAIRALNLDTTKALQSLPQHLRLPESRCSVLAGINGAAIIDSSYNASTQATLDMFNLVATIKQQTNRPVVLLLGDMRELGDQTASEHHKVFQAMQGLVDQLYCVGQLTKQYYIEPYQQQDTKPSQIKWFDNSLLAGQFLKQNLPANAIVLAKGSQNTIYLEEAVKQLLANQSDASKLCRQDKHWLDIKSNFFAKQSSQN